MYSRHTWGVCLHHQGMQKAVIQTVNHCISSDVCCKMACELATSPACLILHWKSQATKPSRPHYKTGLNVLSARGYCTWAVDDLDQQHIKAFRDRTIDPQMILLVEYCTQSVCVGDQYIYRPLCCCLSC